jgi:hypothetical protein
MFNIEVRFKVGGREVPPERFVAQFFRECLGEALNEAMIRLESLPRPAQPLAPVAPVTIPKPERRVVSVREAAQLLGVSPATIRAWTRPAQHSLRTSRASRGHSRGGDRRLALQGSRSGQGTPLRVPRNNASSQLAARRCSLKCPGNATGSHQEHGIEHRRPRAGARLQYSSLGTPLCGCPLASRCYCGAIRFAIRRGNVRNAAGIEFSELA